MDAYVQRERETLCGHDPFLLLPTSNMPQRCNCATADDWIRRLVLAFAQSRVHSILQILHDQMLASRNSIPAEQYMPRVL